MAFIIRQFNHHQCLGDKLKALRKGANITLAEMSEKTKIRKTYLRRLESGSYDKLPDPIYTRNFLKVYLRVLGADEPYFLDLFEQEHGTCDFTKQACLPRQRAGAFRFLVASRFLKIGLFSAVALSVVFYIGLQVRTILTPPKLAIYEPADGYLTEDATILVSGQAEAGSNVHINGVNVLLTKGGNFEVEVALERGLNVIKVEGAKRYSRSAIEYRRVVLEQNKTFTYKP
jgi:transcriptional regulator with XRE-family HTH domain